MPRPPKDITGQTFYHLTAVKLIRTEQVCYSDGRPRTQAIWLWKCQCGNEIEAPARYVCRGFKKSCGCHVRRGDKVPAWNTFNKCYADGDLTFERYCQMSQRNCYYCQAPPSNKRHYHGHVYVYNGLNRLNHDLPHNLTNCRACCWRCNERISRWSEDEFLEWIKLVYETRLANKPT